MLLTIKIEILFKITKLNHLNIVKKKENYEILIILTSSLSFVNKSFIISIFFNNTA